MDAKDKFNYLYEVFTLATKHAGMGVCIIDADTKKIYFANEAGIFKNEGKAVEYQGLFCHKALFNRDEPCENCPLEQTKLGKSEHIFLVEEQGKTFQIKNQILNWGGKELLVEFLTDISDDTKRLEAIEKEKAANKNRFDLAKTKMLNDADLISFIIYDLTNEHFVRTSSGKYCDLTKYRDSPALSSFAQDMSAVIMDKGKQSEYINIHNRNELLKSYFAGEKNIGIDLEMKLANDEERWERVELLMAENPENGDIYLFEYAYDINKEKNVEIMMNFAVNDEYDLIGNVNLHTGNCVLMYGENSFNVYNKSVVEENYDVSLERFVKGGIQDEYQKTYKESASLAAIKKNLQKQNVYEIIFYTKYGNENRVKRGRYSLYGTKSNYCLFTQTDITDILAVEEEKRNKLQEALNDANAATKAKSVFLSRMSHEIRTPLNAIMGINELLQDDLKQGKIDVNALLEHTNDISSSSRFLLSLVNDILDTTKIESGKMEIHPYPVNMERFLNNIYTLLNPMAEDRKIGFSINNYGKMSKQYQFDGVHVQQILMNLLSNAFKFTSRGGYVNLDVKILSSDRVNTTIQFIVRDNGIGMSDGFQKEMFDSFTQEHTEHTSKYGGSGLGLNLVNELIKMMNGTIKCESKIGEGTVFTATLVVENISSGEQEKEPSHAFQDVDKMDFAGVHVLLCEDHPMNQKVTRMLLERKNAIVDIANDGVEGLNAFSKSSLDYYQLILMDIRMPNMDGIETTQKIRSLERKDAKSIPIIALSANAYEEDIKESVDAGVNAHLSKPIEPKLLFNTIWRLIK